MSSLGISAPSTVGAFERRTTILFLLCFVLAQADQQVMGLLAVPIQREFALSNSQLGLLQGFAFAMAYALGGLPIARLLDAGNRVKIAATCVALWSVATMMCGLAGSFAMLFLLRATTAVTEAGLPPAAFSIFGQSGDHRRAARRTSILMLAPFIGGGLVWLLGGMLISAIPSGVIPIPGWSSPWRAVFLVVGLPGLFLAPLLWNFAAEPRRAPTTIMPTLPNFGAVLKIVFVDSPFLRAYYLALTAFYMLSASFSAWYPAYLNRSLGVPVSTAGGYAGAIFLGAGVFGVLTSTLVATLRKHVTTRAMVRDFLLAALLLLPCTSVMTLTGSLQWSLAGYAVYAFLSAFIISSMAVPIQMSLSNMTRARGIALSSFCMSAIGGSLGPLIIGVLVDHAGLSLAQAMAASGSVAIGTGCLLFLLALRTVPKSAVPEGAAYAVTVALQV